MFVYCSLYGVQYVRLCRVTQRRWVWVWVSQVRKRGLSERDIDATTQAQAICASTNIPRFHHGPLIRTLDRRTRTNIKHIF